MMVRDVTGKEGLNLSTCHSTIKQYRGVRVDRVLSAHRARGYAENRHCSGHSGLLVNFERKWLVSRVARTESKAVGWEEEEEEVRCGEFKGRFYPINHGIYVC